MIEKPSHWIPFQFHHRLTVRNCLIISFACVSSEAHNLQAIFFLCILCGSRKYPCPPTKGICCMTHPHLWIFQNRPPKFTPLPSIISKVFAHPLEILLSLIIEVNKEVVLFTRMPNFVSFMYFLLNCMTDKRIPHANSLCAQVTNKFCAFHVISVEFYNSANEMQGRVGNITVLFSLCIKKKATLEEIRTSSRDKTV